MQQGRVADAEHYFRQATQLAPEMAETHLDLGLVLGREGKLEDAIAALRTAIRINPKLKSAHMFLGIFLYQANHQDEARTELQHEIDEDPANAEALTWLGIVELSTGHPERAVAPLDRAAELTPNDPNLLEYRGRAHNLVAQESYARMARIDPGSWHVHRVQAEIYADEGRHAEAIAEYQAAIKLESRNPDLFEGLGDEYRKTSQLDLAQQAYTQELKLSPQNLIAMYNLGSTDVERANYTEGVPLLQTMLRSYTNAPVAEYYLGRGLAAQGESLEAIAWLQKSVQTDKSGEVAKRSYYEMSRLYRKLHRPEDAQRALANYTRLHSAEESKSAQQVEDWRKFDARNAQPASGQIELTPPTVPGPPRFDPK